MHQHRDRLGYWYGTVKYIPNILYSTSDNNQLTFNGYF